MYGRQVKELQEHLTRAINKVSRENEGLKREYSFEREHERIKA